MPVPEERLRAIAALEAPADEVRRAVDALLAAAHELEEREGGEDREVTKLSVNQGVRDLEEAVDSWLEAAGSLEDQLRLDASGATNDRYDAEVRLGGLALAHLSVAEDVSSVIALDDLPGDALVSDVAQASLLPDTTDSSREALIDGGLLRTLSEPIDVEDEGTPIAGASPQAPRVPANSEYVIDSVIEDILGRAGGVGTVIATSVVAPLAHLMIHLTNAVDLTPAHIRTAIDQSVRRIANLVKRLLKRAVELFDSLTGDYREAVREVLREAVGAAGEPLGARLMGNLLRARDVRTDALAGLDTAPDPDASLRRVEKLKRLHGRWVGPVRWVAHGIPKLWAVGIGPVPAGAVVTVVLLAYTVTVTGDQLDSRRIFIPDLWPGVVRRAGGQ